MKNIINNLFIVFFCLSIITGIIQLSVRFKEIYYFDIDYLKIDKLSGISKEEIKLNYDYLIQYNLRKENTDFKMPTIKSSEKGKIHFEEVRDIFQNTIKIFKLSLLISIIGLYINIKNKNYIFLKSTSKLLIYIPVILLIPLAINFDGSFVLFHKIMFNNDYWIFDPNLDPVIEILPDVFFFHMGVIILILIILSSIFCNLLYKLLIKKGELC